MPTYDYQCRSCGHVTEVIHSMREEGPSVCERCGGELRRILYPAGIIFKGSGFYSTDSRAAASTSPAPAGKEQDSLSSSPSDQAPGSSGKEASPSAGKGTKAADAASSS